MTVSGTKGVDVIVTGSGNDVIRGGGGGDRICSGRGDDRVLGGTGNDKLYSGSGDDAVRANLGRDSVQLGPGRDHAHGDRGNDTMGGGPGRDKLHGELDDDNLSGGDGNDTLIGALGTDTLLGGPGKADLLRGDRGEDDLKGGPGKHDVASYSTASPHRTGGYVIVSNTYPGGQGWTYWNYSGIGDDKGGVSVSLKLGMAIADGGGNDTLDGIEDLIGSPFADGLVGDAGPNILDGGGGNDTIYGQEPAATYWWPGLPWPVEPTPDPRDLALGGSGNDTCVYFTRTQSCGEGGLPDPSLPIGTEAMVSESMDGSSLVVTAGAAINDIKVSATRTGAMKVRDTAGLIAGEGCRRLSPTTALCSARSRITHIGVNAGYNDDRVVIDESVPANVSSRLLGDLGNDTLLGGRGGDVIEGGPHFGYDVLRGRGGNDALAAQAGTDHLSGGGGADLLIDEDICFGHTFSGGPGSDSVSFARTSYEVTARIGGTVTGVRRFRGIVVPFFNCAIPDQVSADVEAFEGSRQPDVLYGNDAGNRLQGRVGDDRIYGLGGPDRLVGGAGADMLDGGGDIDQLLSKDGAQDLEIRCGGPGRERVVADDEDEVERGCR